MPAESKAAREIQGTWSNGSFRETTGGGVYGHPVQYLGMFYWEVFLVFPAFQLNWDRVAGLEGGVPG